MTRPYRPSARSSPLTCSPAAAPREWSAPFQSIDAFQAIPVCKEALRLHPDDARLKLAAAFAYIAGRKNEQAKPLLKQLAAQGNSDAMLALAFISTGPRSNGVDA